MKKIVLMVILAGVVGCSSKNCRETREEQASVTGDPGFRGVSKENDPMSKTPLADRIRVYKPDGSLQCGMGDPMSLSTMEKQLGNIKIHRSFNKNDGLMRAQVCGSPTGNSNVYEID